MSYSTMSLVRPQPYLVNNNYKGLKKKEENASSETSESPNSQVSQDEHQPQAPENTSASKTQQQQLIDSKAQHQNAVASRDANLKNATVNIAQILKDFRSTAKAIGASPELTEEVESYLALVEKQATKETPDSKLVRSNLKNASTLLDSYISETLQRPSKVVENWIDALFLQQINFKYNDEEVNQQFLVKFPDAKNSKETDDIEIGNKKNDGNVENSHSHAQGTKSVVVPQDEKLKSLFLSAKKHSYANNSKKAMETFKEALARAIEVEDKDTESKVLFEIGKIYDKNDFLEQALTSYNKSILASTDMNVKTQAHFSMAQIYDDVAQFEPAINHYMSSISYAGENENLIAQSTSLTKIGNIYSDEYKKDALDFLLEAQGLAAQTNNHSTKGYVSTNIANAYSKFKEPQNALKFYSSAVKEYVEADAPLKVAINYKRAAEVMMDFKNYSKAKSLYQKALMSAQKSDDKNLLAEIHQALKMI